MQTNPRLVPTARSLFGRMSHAPALLLATGQSGNTATPEARVFKLHFSQHKKGQGLHQTVRLLAWLLVTGLSLFILIRFFHHLLIFGTR